MSFQLAPNAFWQAELISQFFFNLNSSKNITCTLGKLRTEFTSPKAKSTSPGLSDTTFFARWIQRYILYYFGVYSFSGSMADGCTREELKPVLDQSLTSISGERTNIHCWYASVQYEFKGTDFREKQAFAFTLEEVLLGNRKMHPDVTTGLHLLWTPKRYNSSVQRKSCPIAWG